VSSLASYVGIDGVDMTLNSGRFLINLRPRDDRIRPAHPIDSRPHRSAHYSRTG